VRLLCFRDPSACLPVRLSCGTAALGAQLPCVIGTLAACSLAMCGLRTCSRTDVDPPQVEPPSAAGISSRRPRSDKYCSPNISLIAHHCATLVCGEGSAAYVCLIIQLDCLQGPGDIFTEVKTEKHGKELTTMCSEDARSLCYSWASCSVFFTLTFLFKVLLLLSTLSIFNFNKMTIIEQRKIL